MPERIAARSFRSNMTLHPSVYLPKWSQPDKGWRLHKLILDTLRSPNPEVHSNIIPDLAVMEGPPLPSTVLSAEALDNLPPARMFRDVTGAIQDNIIHNDYCSPRPHGQLVREELRLWWECRCVRSLFPFLPSPLWTSEAGITGRCLSGIRLG